MYSLGWEGVAGVEGWWEYLVEEMLGLVVVAELEQVGSGGAELEKAAKEELWEGLVEGPSSFLLGLCFLIVPPLSLCLLPTDNPTHSHLPQGEEVAGV